MTCYSDFMVYLLQKPRVVTMSAYKDYSGLFTSTPIEIDSDIPISEQRTTMNTSLEKVFNMENR